MVHTIVIVIMIRSDWGHCIFAINTADMGFLKTHSTCAGKWILDSTHEKKSNKLGFVGRWKTTPRLELIAAHESRLAYQNSTTIHSKSEKLLKCTTDLQMTGC